MREDGGRWPRACGSLAGVLQANFLLELALPGALPLSTSLVSELSAPGQPFAWAYRAGDLLATVLTLEVARLLVSGWRTRTGRLTGVLVAVYAVGLGVSALVPTDCADGLGQCGGHVVLTSGAGFADRVHDLVSIASALGLLVAAGTGAVVLRRRGSPRHARLLAATGVLATVLGTVALAQVVLDHSTGQGYVQRTQVALSSVLVALLAEAVGATRARPRARPGPDRALSPRREPAPPAC